MVFSCGEYRWWIRELSLKKTKLHEESALETEYCYFGCEGLYDLRNVVKNNKLCIRSVAFQVLTEYLPHLRKVHRLTASSSPPAREHLLARHSTRWSPLKGDPINCGETVWGIVIPSSSSNTRCKLSAVNTFDPRCGGFMYEGMVRVINVVNSKLYVYFLVRVKYIRLKLNDITLILRPGRRIFERMSSFLKWEAYREMIVIKSRFDRTFVCKHIPSHKIHLIYAKPWQWTYKNYFRPCLSHGMTRHGDC